MESFKLEHFRKENLGKEFPWHRSLSLQEAAELRDRLATAAGLDPAMDELLLTRALCGLGTPLNSLDPEEHSFDFSVVLKESGIAPRATVFLNWYRYSSLDEMRLDDLSTHFLDVWYPAADDLDVFDATCNWLVSIDHGGRVSIWKGVPEPEKGPGTFS